MVLRESPATLENAFDVLAGISDDFLAGRRNDNSPVEKRARFAAATAGEVGMSTITSGELIWGAQVSSKPKENLQRKGAPIGPNDLWIAAHARAAGLVLASNNEREFKRVPGLKVENWARA